MKKIILCFILALSMIIPSAVSAYDTEITLKSAVTDPVNKQIILSGNINMAGDRPILINMYSSDGKTAYSDIVISDSNGSFSTSVGVSGLSDGEYKIYAKYRSCEAVLLYTFYGIGDVSPSPIKAEVLGEYAFMKDGKNVDSEFGSVNIKLKNAKVLTGTLPASGYEIFGLPDGIIADVTASAEDTLLIKLSGKANEDITEKCDISLKLKSNIIVSGEANTDSDEIGGITLYPYTYGQRVITDKNTAAFSMETYNTPSKSDCVFTLKYRALAVDGTLARGTHYTYSDSAISGMTISAAADKKSGTIKLYLTGESKSPVTAGIIINDFTFKSVIAENASLDSEPVTVSISPSTKQTNPPTGGGGATGGGGTAGGGSVIKNPSSVSPEPIIPVIPTVLTDIENHWGKANIEKLNKLGYIGGYEDGTFRPDNNITRAEFTVLVVRILKADNVKYKGSFSDVDAKDWFSDSVETALGIGLISSDSSFRPNDNITRAELTKIAVSAYLMAHEKPKNETPLTSFMDSDVIPDWAGEYVLSALNLGLVQGDSDRNFNPGNNATRAEAATILSRLVDCLNL